MEIVGSDLMGDIEKGRCWIKVVQMDNFRKCKENRYNTECTGLRIVWREKRDRRENVFLLFEHIENNVITERVRVGEGMRVGA